MRTKSKNYGLWSLTVPHWRFAYANAFSTGPKSQLMILSLVASFILVFRISTLEV